MGEGHLPVLMDFGSTSTAKVVIDSRQAALNLTDQAAEQSSMPYRAPELFDARTGVTVDGRTDVWSLGALLYAMAFGYSPFECTFAQERGVRRGASSGGGGGGGGGEGAAAGGGDKGEGCTAVPAAGLPMPVPLVTDCSYLRVIGAVQFPPREQNAYSALFCGTVQWLLAAAPEDRPDVAAVLHRLERDFGPGATSTSTSTSTSISGAAAGTGAAGMVSPTVSRGAARGNGNGNTPRPLGGGSTPRRPTLRPPPQHHAQQKKAKAAQAQAQAQKGGARPRSPAGPPPAEEWKPFG
jgi:serine/threonine protein kinase